MEPGAALGTIADHLAGLIDALHRPDHPVADASPS
jgi:hypothetical protein